MLFGLCSVIHCEYSISIHVRYVCYKFWALAVNIGTQPCKHCCQSMTLAYLTCKKTSIFVHLGDRFFDFYTLHYNNFFSATCTVKTSILLWYNLGMRYRLSLLSTQSAQPLLSSDNLNSSQLLVPREDTRSVLRYTWREILPCFLILFFRVKIQKWHFTLRSLRNTIWRSLAP